MSSQPDYDAFEALAGGCVSGETDLLEVMQLCTGFSSTPTDGDLAPVQPFYEHDPAMDDLLSSATLDAWETAIQRHEQRCREIENLGICLDISSSLATCMRTHSAYPVLEPQLRDELVALYFDHVHPLCPVIDEQNFWWHYMTLNEDEFLDMFPAIMFNAMLFAAFGHASDQQVRRAGFSSVDQVQSQYFHLLRETYDHANAQVLCRMGDLVLAKTSLLLSLWCPPKSDITASSIWADRAIFHTKRHLQQTPTHSMPLPKRRDILLWCCVLRSTFISYSMGRPYQPGLEDESLCDPNDVRPEFDRELQFHQFCSPAAKARMVEDFVTTCKLSLNFRKILYLQHCRLFSIAAAEYPTPTQDRNQTDLHDCLSRYLQTAKVESDIVDLIELHESAKRRGAVQAGSERASEVIAARSRSYTLQIMAFSAIASLYQATISADASTWARSCYRTALCNLFDASKQVACIVEHILSDMPLEAIPGNLMAWTVSPMIPLLVEQKCDDFGLPGLSFDNDSDSDNDSEFDDLDSEDSKRLSPSRGIASILELTRRMAPRFHSARDALALYQSTDHNLCLDIAKADLAHAHHPPGTPVERRNSWELLNKTVRFVESEMAGAYDVCGTHVNQNTT